MTKRYLGKASERVKIRRNGGPMMAGEWVTREQPIALRDSILVQQRFALTFDRIETGDQIEDSAGLLWIAVEVKTTSSAGQHPLFDVRLGEV